MQPRAVLARLPLPAQGCLGVQTWDSGFVFGRVVHIRTRAWIAFSGAQDRTGGKAGRQYIGPMSTHAWRRLSELLPSSCQVCERWPAQPVCSACEKRFAPLRLRCRTCAAHISASSAETDLCGACRTRTTPVLVRSCVAAVDYAYPWDGLMARFKFRGEPGWAGPMAALLLKNPQAVALLQACDRVVPVPLTPTRLASRGYNQSWELVKALHRAAPNAWARHKALPDALVRLGEVPDQHSLSREQRMRNLQGVFAAHPLRTAPLLGAHVLLVDDVTTTGATLHSAAQALRQAGALQVSALVFARTASAGAAG